MIRTVIVILQIVVSVFLIGVILLQAKGTGLGNSSLFGGSGEFYSSKRGLEKFVFIGTIVLAALFGVFSVALLLIK